MSDELTKAVLAYQETGEGWEDLFKKICLYIYYYPRYWTNWDEDRCSDFFLSFFSRMRGLVNHYRPQGRSFLVYLSSSLRWHLRTFAKKTLVRDFRTRFEMAEFGHQTEEAAETPDYSNWNQFSPPKVFSGVNKTFALDETGRLIEPVTRKRLLFLILLRGVDLDQDMIRRAAVLCAVEVDWLEDKLEEVKSLLERRIENRETLRRRRNEYWYRRLETLYRADDEIDAEKKGLLEEQAAGWLKRFAHTKKMLENLSVTPTHADVARILEVPKGTVDSGVFYFREAWNDFLRCLDDDPNGD